jgi:hypothetical protein
MKKTILFTIVLNVIIVVSANSQNKKNTSLNNCAFDTSIVSSNGTLTVAETGANYQWIQCGNLLSIPQATQQSYSPSDAWSYFVIITKNGCVDTSNCRSIGSDALSSGCGIDTTITLSGGVFSASETGATYQWIFCNTGGLPINNANGQTYQPTFGGEYAVIINKNNCTDTSICLSLNSIALSPCNTNVSISQQNGIMTCNIPNASYQWINCNIGVAMPNATSQSFTPPFAGVYAVAVTINNCTDTSSCIAAQTIAQNPTGIKDTQNTDISVKIYPNPSNGIYTIENYKDAELIITDVLGKQILAQKIAKGLSEINLTTYNNGVYFIKIKSADTTNVIKLIKE